VGRSLFRVLAFSFAAALAACSGGRSGGVLPTHVQSLAMTPGGELLGPDNGYYPLVSHSAMRPVCPPVVRPGEMRCFAWTRTDLHPVLASAGIPSGVGYTPSQIQSAYDLNPSRGGGQTVAIVDADGDPTAASDLAVYRRAAGLPACTTASRCLRIVNENGQSSPLPPANDNWIGEQTLDLDAVSAVCPKCHIILLEANSSYTSDLYKAVATAGSMGANVISNSYGGNESSGAPPAAFNQPGRVIVASAGDVGGGSLYGGGPEMPCTYASVVCVGGTRLTHLGGVWRQRVWNDLSNNSCTPYRSCGGTGSGCSVYVHKPSWQHDQGCRMRSAVDVSADASPFTPLAVYSVAFRKYGSAWQPYGGTSLAAPLIAGVFALAGNARTRHGAQEIWQNHAALKDVTYGTNLYPPITGGCASPVTYICVAGPGYDGPTGWGTPHGVTDF
jgi:subtilase family serine protease